MRQLILALTLLAAGCVPMSSGPTFRDKGAPIYSRAAFDPARMAGGWHEVAGFYDPQRHGCSTGLTEVYAEKGGAIRLTLANCAGYGARSVRADRAGAAARFRPDLPGRLGEPWWVLWVDEDYRAMAIGTPSGRFGAILSRSVPMRPDLYEAARRVLDFNGYDLRKLKPIMK